MGDVRMGLAEDSKKVERIVSGSYSGFQQLYLPLLQVINLWSGSMCATSLHCARVMVSLLLHRT